MHFTDFLFLYVIYDIFELWRHKLLWDDPQDCHVDSFGASTKSHHATTICENRKHNLVFGCTDSLYMHL